LLLKSELVNAVMVAPVAAATVFAEPGFIGGHRNLAELPEPQVCKCTAGKMADSANRLPDIIFATTYTKATSLYLFGDIQWTWSVGCDSKPPVNKIYFD
jgi:hypothetical protein